MSSLGLGLGLNKGSFVGGFSPTSIQGLNMWFDVADLSTITKDGSNKVSAWVDKSVNANNVIQATGANQPLYTATGFGTKNGPSIVFNGTTQFLNKATSPTGLTNVAGSIFIVGKKSVNNVDTGVFSLSSGTSIRFNFSFSSANKFVFNQRNSDTSDIATSTPTYGIATFAINMNSTQIAYTMNTNNATTAFTMTSGSNTGDWCWSTPLNAVNIGRYVTASASYLNGSIAEIISYDTDLSAENKTKVFNYLNEKYGLY